jgi:predicted transcriptional regulator of viral defense system
LAALAGRQHGVVSVAQLHRLGFDRRWIELALAHGRLHRLYRGVYAVGHPGVSAKGWTMAAVLALGPHAVASHRSAAALHGLLPSWPNEPEVTVAAKRGSRAGIYVHTSRRLARAQTSRRENIPVTTPARTILDLADTEPERTVEKAMAEGEALRLLYRSTLAQELARTPGRKGAVKIQAILARDHIARTRSELEEAFLAWIRTTDLPEPEMNQPAAGFKEVDGIWREQRVVLELDSLQFHGTRAKFESDRRRDIALQIAGHRIARITWARLDEPESLYANLDALLAA